MDPHNFSSPFCEFVVILPHPFSIATTTSQLFSSHLSFSQFSQLFPTALKVVPSPPTIELQHTTVEHIALMQQFQCTKCRNTCKKKSHSIHKEEKKSPGTFSSTARANRIRIDGKARIAAPVAQSSLLFSATEHPLTKKNTNVSCKS